jgi:AraC-like DNA-binding protein
MHCPALVTARSLHRVAGLVEVPTLLRELGSDPNRVLRAAGLDPHALDHMDRKISIGDIDRLFGSCTAHTGCAYFGLLAGQRWRLSHLGMIGDILESGPTVGDSLRSYAVAQQLSSAVGGAFVSEAGDSATLGYALYQFNLRWPDQVYDCSMAILVNALRALCRLHWTAHEVQLSRALPPDTKPYKSFFRTKLSFDRTFSAIRFSRRWMAQPNTGADAHRHMTLLQAIQIHDDAELIPRLRRALRLLLMHGTALGDDLARMLSMHRRTLNRRLHEKGTTFQKLLDEVRLDVARELLRHTDSDIEAIASALCYADSCGFAHAFKRWTGTSPGHFRFERSAHRRGAPISRQIDAPC